MSAASVCEISVEQIDDIDDVSGLYAWIAAVPTNTTRSDYLEILDQHFYRREFTVTLAAHLADRYAGSAGRVPLGTGWSAPPDLLHIAAKAFAPPIYVGMSEHLRSRLRTHRKHLLDVIYGRSVPPVPSEEAEPDSDRESANFGTRLGEVMRRARLNDLRWLSIRVLRLPGATRADLLAVESSVNRLFAPALGRR